MEKKLLVTAGILGTISVILGAFAAHGLKPILSSNELESFQTGVRYQFYHAFFLMFIALIPGLTEGSKSILYILIVLGVILFSGSIYILCLDEHFLKTKLTAIAFITPLGGTLLIAAWVIFTIKIIKYLPNS